MKTFNESLKELEVVADGFWGKLDKLSKDILSVEDTLKDLHVEFFGDLFTIDGETYKFWWGKMESGKYRLLLEIPCPDGRSVHKAFSECRAATRVATFPYVQPFIEKITNHIKSLEV